MIDAFAQRGIEDQFMIVTVFVPEPEFSSAALLLLALLAMGCGDRAARPEPETDNRQRRPHLATTSRGPNGDALKIDRQ